MARYYIVIILLGIGALASIWLTIKYDPTSDVAKQLERVFPRFIVYLAIGLTLLLGITWLIDTHGSDVLSDARVVSVLAGVLGLFIYLISRKFEPKNTSFFKRQSSVILLVFILPLAGYWALTAGVDPIIISPIAFIGTLAAVTLISRNWR